jgi:hypothetical protein
MGAQAPARVASTTRQATGMALPRLLEVTLLDLLRFFLPWYAGCAFGMLGTRLISLNTLRNVIVSRPLDRQRDEGHAT